MPEIKLTHVTKRWGKFYAVDDLSLDMEDNSFITLLGPSGCGKTTTLRMIAGLETPTSGQIKIGDQVVFDSEAGINVPANKRKVGFLFQNYALWPNMTVYQNISFGLGNIKEELPVIDEDAKALKSMIKALEPGLLHRLLPILHLTSCVPLLQELYQHPWQYRLTVRQLLSERHMCQHQIRTFLLYNQFHEQYHERFSEYLHMHL